MKRDVRSPRPSEPPAHASPESTILELVDRPLESGAIALTSGRRIEAEARPDGDVLRVRAPGGEVVLSVLITEAGPVLRFESAAIELEATRKVAVTCDQFEVNARAGASITTGGDLTLEANDDVNVRGERIRLNCDEAPMAATWDELLARARRDH
jgi:hypothetical protein